MPTESEIIAEFKRNQRLQHLTDDEVIELMKANRKAGRHPSQAVERRKPARLRRVK